MTGTVCFAMSPSPAGTELVLLQGGSAQPFDRWALLEHPGVDLVQRFLVDDEAVQDTRCVLVEHATIARLTTIEATTLGLPALANAQAIISSPPPGLMTKPDFAVNLRWTRPGGQNIVGASRIGSWLNDGAQWGRLSEPLFRLAEAVDAHAVAAAAKDEARRMSAVAALQRALPAAAHTGGVLGKTTIMEADSLSLAATGVDEALQIVPVLQRERESQEPLLDCGSQAEFARQFSRWQDARAVYALPGGVFVAVSPDLRQALTVVHAINREPPAERLRFLREPRARLHAPMPEDDQPAPKDLIVETTAWSERVIGLGLWEKRVLPWIALPSNAWFDSAATPVASTAYAAGLTIGDTCLPLEPQQARSLLERVEAAQLAGQAAIAHLHNGQNVMVPATAATIAALQAVVAGPKRGAIPPPAPPQPATPQPVLLIKPNECRHDVEFMVHPRFALPHELPACVVSTLKPHQHAGLDWLQSNWCCGAPGVLLADDMGLGKTLQGLAFMAWLRAAMEACRIPRRPLLVVAPTGLLNNWLAEHDIHLRPPRLGTPLAAFGAGLRALRGEDGRLDRSAIAAADWVLTTYETVRDHDADFGQVDFALVLLDEAQKVKTPAIRMTDAVKALRADFRIAMTGTPVENRLADLWCILDGVSPGILADLKSFSARYEKSVDEAALERLRDTLDRPLGSRPAVLLRRLKEAALPGLPGQTESVVEAVMRGDQLVAYENARAMARTLGQGGVLAALQSLRAASLDAGAAMRSDDAALVEGSARLRVALTYLEEVRQKGEAALVFINNLDFMARLVTLLQRRFQMPEPPLTITGQVAGHGRQARVDKFQSKHAGFDVMLMSPRAGGVGLTLTRANHVIHLDRWWNPAVEDQCTARARRIGQTRHVQILLPIATLQGAGQSFDQNLHTLLSRKRQMMRDALLPPPATDLEQQELLRRTVS